LKIIFLKFLFSTRSTWNVRVYLDDTGANEGDSYGDSVDRQLELKKLGDAVIDVTAPYHRLDNTREVIIGENDIRRLLGHVRASYALNNNIMTSTG